MAVDKGGLDYRIVVADGFSTNTKKFRAEILASKKVFADFRRDAASLTAVTQDSTRASRARSGSLSVEEEATRKLNRELRKTAVAKALDRQATERGIVSERTARDQARARANTERTKARLARQATLNARELAKAERDRTRATLAAERVDARRFSGFIRQRAALQGVSDAQAQAALRTRQALPAIKAQTEAQKQFAGSSDKLRRSIPRATRGIKSLGRASKRTAGTMQTLLFTFRRLIGVFAAFAVARAVIGAFRALVFQGIRFNAQLEQAELGIAAVIAAAGDVSDAFGGAADKATQFALAQGEARKQVQALRRDALATNATFEQLLDTFQVAIGPGLAAGLDVDEIRKLSIRISQAATAIGLPQNQLAEEIRSILAGTIQLRTTRLAAVLGITNEDIKNARELGQLAQFLETQFEAFGLAGEESLRNLNVLFVNTADGLRQVLAAGTEDTLFQETVDTLRDLFGVLNELDADGKSIGLNPAAVELAREFTVGLGNAVAVARELIKELEFEDILPIARAFSGVVTGIATVAGALISGLINGLSDALVIVNSVATVIGAIARFIDSLANTDSIIGALVSGTSRLVVGFITLRGVVFVISGLFSAMLKFAILPLVAGAIKTLESFQLMIPALAKVRVLLLSIGKTPLLILFTLLAATLIVIAEKIGLMERLFSVFLGDVEAAEVATEKLSKQFDTLGGQIAGGAKDAEAFEKTILRVTEELKKTQDQATFDLSVTGLEGTVRRERQIIFEADQRIRKETKDLVRQQEVAEQNLLGVQAKQRDTAKEITALSREQKLFVEVSVVRARDQLKLTSDGVVLQREIASLQVEADNARRRGAIGEADVIQLRLDGLREEKALNEIALDDARARTDRSQELIESISKRLKLTSDDQLKIASLISDRIKQEGAENATVTQINALLERRAEIEQLINDATSKRIQALAAEEANRLGQQNAILAVQVANAERLANARTTLFDIDTIQIQIALAQNELALEQEKISLQEKQLELQRLAAIEVLGQTDNLEEQAAVLDSINGIQVQQALNTILSGRAIDELRRKVELLKLAEREPVKAGFLTAIEEFSARALDTFQNSLDLMRTALEGFTDLVADSIVDAFDPTKKVDLKERFARFLQDIARLIIEQLIKIALVKTVLNQFTDNAGGGSGGGGGSGFPFGASFAKGGTVGEWAGAHPAHFAPGVAHFGEGGGVSGTHTAPPPGVPRSDTVAAWLTPGEKVTPLAAVNKYDNTGIFEALRQQILPVSLVRAMMIGTRLNKSRVRSSRGIGYQTGGSVRSAGAAASAVAGTGTGSMIAVIANSEQAVERLNAGGRAAQIRFMAEHRDEINGALNPTS